MSITSKPLQRPRFIRATVFFLTQYPGNVEHVRAFAFAYQVGPESIHDASIMITSSQCSPITTFPVLQY